MRLNRHVRYQARKRFLAEEGRQCALCGADDVDLCVDHNHRTGEPRGLLCHGCNMMLGFIEQSGVPLEEIEAYLQRGIPRIERERLFMGVAKQFARRSTCPRRSVGAVFVRDNRVIAHGYNGAPPGLPHCTEVGCLIGPSGGCERALHAESNAIMYAARRGVSTEGSVGYVTTAPCLQCAKLLVIAGVVKVIAARAYRDPAGVNFLNEAGVGIEIL